MVKYDDYKFVAHTTFFTISSQKTQSYIICEQQKYNEVSSKGSQNFFFRSFQRFVPHALILIDKVLAKQLFLLKGEGVQISKLQTNISQKEQPATFSISRTAAVNFTDSRMISNYKKRKRLIQLKTENSISPN